MSQKNNTVMSKGSYVNPSQKTSLRKILLIAQRDQPEGIPSSHSYLGHFAIFQTMQVQNAGH